MSKPPREGVLGLVLHPKDERVFPRRMSVSLKDERAANVFTEGVVRFINCFTPLHRLVPHPTDECEHAACSHRGNEALDTEKSATSWSATARDLHTSECREGREPTATG